MNALENGSLYALELVLRAEVSGIRLLDAVFLVFVLFLYFTECALPSVVVLLPVNPCHSKEMRFPEFDKEEEQSP